MPPRTRIKLLKGTALQLAAAKLHYASEKITEKVKPILERSPIKDHAYTIKARTKSPARIVRKVEEKREEAKRNGLKPSFNPENLTDGSGLRVITLFQNDIPSVVKILLELVSHDPQYAEFPFVKDGLAEVEVYTYRPDNDPYRIADAVKKWSSTLVTRTNSAPPRTPSPATPRST